LSSKIVSPDLFYILKTTKQSSHFFKRSSSPKPFPSFQFFFKSLSLLSILFFNIKNINTILCLLNKNIEKLSSHSSSWTLPVNPKLDGNSYHFYFQSIFDAVGSDEDDLDACPLLFEAPSTFRPPF